MSNVSLVEKILTYSSFNLNKFRYKQTYTGIKEGCQCSNNDKIFDNQQLGDQEFELNE